MNNLEASHLPRPVVALVGRSNVGKSTLFNLLSLNKKVITHDSPGVTRDRIYARARIGDFHFTVIDTPGIEQDHPLRQQINQQTLTAIQEADVVCLVVDSTVGVTHEDQDAINIIRKESKFSKCICLANKSEKPFYPDKSYYTLTLDNPIPISAAHKKGLPNLLEQIQKIYKKSYHPASLKVTKKEDSLSIAIVGRPNSGKSTFVNSIVGSEKVLTGPEAGVTRDSTETIYKYKDNTISLIDTAGVRKKSNIHNYLEKFSVQDTLKSIRFANTVVLMVDATRSLEHQDLILMNYILNEGRCLILAINKCDLIDNKLELKTSLEKYLAKIKIEPIYISALNHKLTNTVLDYCLIAYKDWNKKFSTAKLNQWLYEATSNHPLPLQPNGRRIRIKYCTQVKSRPPTIKLFVNDTNISDSYQSYLVQDLRKKFQLYSGVPIRLSLHKTNNPYAGRRRPKKD